MGITQNISTAYHPQTNGQSERTNQWLEQYLRIYGNARQDDWHQYLPLAQFVHNSWPNETTKKAPFELIMGTIPRSSEPKRDHYVPAIKERSDEIVKIRWQAQKAIKYAQELMKEGKSTRTFKPYQLGQRVWLKATNLKMTHPTAKLAPKRYGPFEITKIISPIVYQLKLPDAWNIHNVFHASLLSPYNETKMHGPNYLEPSPRRHRRGA